MTTTTTITTSNNNVEQTIINENIYSKLNNLSTSKAKFRKILLLIIAVTVHNIPGKEECIFIFKKKKNFLIYVFIFKRV